MPRPQKARSPAHVRIDEIPVRGLKRISSATSRSGEGRVRIDEIPVRGLKRIAASFGPDPNFFVRIDEIPVRGLKHVYDTHPLLRGFD